MYIHIYIYIYIDVHTYIYIYIYTHTHTIREDADACLASPMILGVADGVSQIEASISIRCKDISYLTCIKLTTYNSCILTCLHRFCTSQIQEMTDHTLHDRHLYTATNKCLQCLIKIMYTVF